MNKNPWHIIEPYKAMYTDIIAISGVRKRDSYYTSLKACVFDQQDVDPFCDSDATTNLKMINVLISYDNWMLNIKPQIGDTITLENAEKYKVVKVSESMGLYDLNCRSI